MTGASGMQGLARWPVVVTRDEPADGPLSSELRAQGLQVLSWPVLQVLAPEDPAPLAATLRAIDSFHWIVFASRHAVAAVIRQLPRPPASLRISAVGDATAQALRAAGWQVDLVPGEANAAALAAALAPRLKAGSRVLYPASSRSLPTLMQNLAGPGRDIVRVEAYQVRAATLDTRSCRALIEQGGIGAVTFTSPSAVMELDQALGTDSFDGLLSAAHAVTLGPTTGRALAARGFPSVLATPATLPGVARTARNLLQLRV